MSTRDLVDPVRIGSAIWYQMGPFMKVIPYETITLKFGFDFQLMSTDIPSKFLEKNIYVTCRCTLRKMQLN